MVLGEDNEKMSKSRGNVVAPDRLVERYGADTVRAYLMFFARWEMGAPWDSQGIEGSARWVRRAWTLFTDDSSRGEPSNGSKSSESTEAARPYDGRDLRRKVHQKLKRITRDFENFEFNTIVSGLMELLNELYKAREAGAVGSKEWQEAQEIYIKMMAPVTPHIAEELWTEVLGKKFSIHEQAWPKVDEEAARDDEITIPVQVNGKVRDRVVVSAEAGEEEIKSAALAAEGVIKHLDGQTPKKVIVVKKNLVNIVV